METQQNPGAPERDDASESAVISRNPAVPAKHTNIFSAGRRLALRASWGLGLGAVSAAPAAGTARQPG